MRRHELLRNLHELVQPRTYFEIGVSKGVSLALSRTRTVAVDPYYEISNEILCDLHLVRTTSDEFFARRHPFAHFDEPRVDLAFIDGMHLAEYALRDVINTERYTSATSIIVLDDMLPRSVDEAGRGREGTARHGAWAGDVYKLVSVIRAARPDLICLEVDTQPTGTVVLMGLDSASSALADAYDDLVEQFVTADPQTVPAEILGRTRAIQPEQLVAAPFWDTLRGLRGVPDEDARPQVRTLLQSAGLLQP
jgi:hypothetical protein